MDFVESLKGVYYSIEDRYYSFLDFLESKKIPVYKIIDPIDEVIPSFALFCLIILLLAFGIAWLLLFSSPQYSLEVRVVSMEDNKPIKDARVDFKYWPEGSNDITQAFAKTDNDGKFLIEKLSGPLNFEFSVKNIAGFKDYKSPAPEKVSADSGSVKILLEKKPVTPPAGDKKIIVMDATPGSPKKRMQNKNINVVFECSSGRSLDERDTLNSEIVISASDVALCGTITATVTVLEYTPLTLELADSTTYFDLVKESALKGKLSVIVKSQKTNAILPGIKLTAYNSNNSAKGNGRTGEDGSLSFELEAGSYYVHAVDDINGKYKNYRSPVASVAAQEDTSLEIFMEEIPPATQRFLRVKVLDSNNHAPIEGAKVYYSTDGILGSSPLSTVADGTVDYGGFDSNNIVYIRVTSTGYVSQFARALLKTAGDKNYQEIVLARQRDNPANFAKARVYVRDDLGSLVEGATAKLYNNAYPSMPLADETDGQGLADFQNEALPEGDYNAFAEKGFPIYASAWSDKRHIALGAVEDFNLTLVLGLANIAVKVVNETGGPIPDANVEFFESDTSEFNDLADYQAVTMGSGLTVPFGFKVNKKVKIKASKQGFMGSYRIVDGLYRTDVSRPITVTIGLYPTGYAGEFTMNLREELYPEGCLGELPAAQQKISANGGKYGLVFDVIVPETQGQSNIKSHVRSDKDSVPNEASAIIKVWNAQPSFLFPMRFADLNLSDFYSTDQNQVTDPAKAAKLVNLSLGSMSSSVQSFCTTFLVTKQRAGTELEIKYTSKSDEKSLPVFTKKLTVGQSFCRTNCPLFDYEFSACQADATGCVSGQEIMEPNSINAFSAVYRQDYLLSYNITNHSRQNITEDFNTVFSTLTGFINFGGSSAQSYSDSIIPARMAQFSDSASTGAISAPFKVVLKADNGRLNYELDALRARGLADTNGYVLFSINASDLSVETPNYLLANRPGQHFEVLVRDLNNGSRLQNADVTVKITDSRISDFEYSPNDITSLTDSGGFAYFTLTEGYDSTHYLSVRVARQGYDDKAVLNIPFSNSLGPAEEFACVSFGQISDPCSFDDSQMCLQSSGNTSGTFVVKTENCPEPVNVKLISGYSAEGQDVSLAISPELEAVLSENDQSQLITVDSDDASRTPSGVLGQFPIYAELSSASIGTPVRKELAVLVNFPSTMDCFAIGKTEYDLATQPEDSNIIENYCYVSNSDPMVPSLSTSAGSLLRTYVTGSAAEGDEVQFQWKVRADVLEKAKHKAASTGDGNRFFVVNTGIVNNADFEGDTTTPDAGDDPSKIHQAVKNATSIRFLSYYPADDPSNTSVDSNLAFIKDDKIKLNLKGGGSSNITIPCSTSGCTWAAKVPNSACTPTGDLPGQCVLAYFDVALTGKPEINTIEAFIRNPMNDSFVYFEVSGEVDWNSEETLYRNYTVYSEDREGAVIPGRDLEIRLGSLDFGISEIRALLPPEFTGTIADLNISIETTDPLVSAWIVGNSSSRILEVFAAYYGQKLTLPVDGSKETIPFSLRNTGWTGEGYTLVNVSDYSTGVRS